MENTSRSQDTRWSTKAECCAVPERGRSVMLTGSLGRRARELKFNQPMTAAPHRTYLSVGIDSRQNVVRRSTVHRSFFFIHYEDIGNPKRSQRLRRTQDEMIYIRGRSVVDETFVFPPEPKCHLWESDPSILGTGTALFRMKRSCRDPGENSQAAAPLPLKRRGLELLFATCQATRPDPTRPAPQSVLLVCDRSAIILNRADDSVLRTSCG